MIPLIVYLAVHAIGHLVALVVIIKEMPEMEP